MKAIRHTLLVALVALAVIPAAAKIKVACVGNSITYGMTIPDREVNSYPAQLQRLLGDDYEVRNFGRSGATLLRQGHFPYVTTAEYAAAVPFGADIAIIHLGTNDTDPRNWPNHSEEFIPDYLALIDTLRSVNPNMRVIVANMAPIGTEHRRFKSGTRAWRDSIRAVIPIVAEAADAELIDFDTPLHHHRNRVPDTLHPTAIGAGLLADYVYSAITGQWGGLKLPEVWSSGMVLPRHKPLRMRGTADAGAPVSVTFNGRTYTTTASNTGTWAVTFPSMEAGGPYVITVTDGKDTLTLTDVMVGEVWLASGQSNMEFTLAEGDDSPENPAPDGMLRVFHMKDRQRPGAGVWDSTIMERVNRADYYLPARWATPERDFSAVAWHFGRMLADSLGVTVGIIENAVGGSGIEDWIDIETLRHTVPDVLVGWTTNDYVQPWVRGRALENMGSGDYVNRHPYEPSYLYTTGIAPLAGYPITGVLWYQGESNAHNVELHEELFRIWVDDWRREFSDPQLPFIMAQLSGIERPSWAWFRDSQRRLADAMDGVEMAVTHDYGAKYDVHPRRKAPVGRRMALQALRSVYGHDITSSGPRPVKATEVGGVVTLLMADGYGMTTADSAAVRTFELAGADGVYLPADSITLLDNKIILRNMKITSPRHVRYGWQPYTDANLVNDCGLPASTFHVNVAPAEPGLECGVSAAFGGTLPDGTVIMAGGCNFPQADPLAADARKVYYQGIYRAADGARLGSLPRPTAYGASATTDLGIAMIGGEGLKSAWLLTPDMTIEELPELPVTVDNAAACASGRKLYVAGGNADGTPSRRLFTLDLNNLAAGWQELPSMPGHPRVQPVMAAGADGKLYLWGGFAGRHEGYDKPTLETDGLLYDPEKQDWTTLPAPKGPDGKELTLSGGVAAAVDGGNRIVCAGGVNKDVFLSAIRKLPEGYLMHPASWYRFNPYLCTFDVNTGRWTVTPDANPDLARAGAAAAVDAEGRVWLMGGELKPRIRTPKVTKI